ncbi:MAG: HoxN/HupN/NixA family nickel/cobalt transporter [Enhydrobacter sp.]|nr:HoxN/HupN/NixA family nickel/cobalt transporter [Enhydrobacter sp.]
MQPIWGLLTSLVLANVGAWAWAFVAFQDQPFLLGTALLAWSLGLRHAVDADHIAAIDNVTRKLIQAGRPSVAVGLFFALGHSAVVALAVIGLASAAPLLGGRLEEFKEVGGLIGALASSLFLFAIALVNLVILRSLWRIFRRVQNGGDYVEEDLDAVLRRSGFLVRLCRPLFGLITRPWHMLLLGFLFGLGFDTATEVALLGLAASQAANGLPIWSVLVFPALFAAGMALVDTADGVLMARAYGWAFVKPVRRLHYNLAITSVSVVVAVAVGSIQVLGLLGERLGPSGAIWDMIAGLNDNADGLGFMIIGVFIAIWIGAIAFYRYRRRDPADAAAD